MAFTFESDYNKETWMNWSEFKRMAAWEIVCARSEWACLCNETDEVSEWERDKKKITQKQTNVFHVKSIQHYECVFVFVFVWVCVFVRYF